MGGWREVLGVVLPRRHDLARTRMARLGWGGVCVGRGRQPRGVRVMGAEERWRVGGARRGGSLELSL